jgi:antitoxin ParD1/3/4
MNISLTPHLEKYIHDKVEGGLYHSASEVVRDSLRFMIEAEQQKVHRLKEFNDEIDRGLKQLSRGEKIPAQEVFDTLRKLDQ